jgi:hypothetical protein
MFDPVGCGILLVCGVPDGVALFRDSLGGLKTLHR